MAHLELSALITAATGLAGAAGRGCWTDADSKEGEEAAAGAERKVRMKLERTRPTAF
jgi:hypothetical protein